MPWSPWQPARTEENFYSRHTFKRFRCFAEQYVASPTGPPHPYDRAVMQQLFEIASAGDGELQEYGGGTFQFGYENPRTATFTKTNTGEALAWHNWGFVEGRQHYAITIQAHAGFSFAGWDTWRYDVWPPDWDPNLVYNEDFTEVPAEYVDYEHTFSYVQFESALTGEPNQWSGDGQLRTRFEKHSDHVLDTMCECYLFGVTTAVGQMPLWYPRTAGTPVFSQYVPAGTFTAFNREDTLHIKPLLSPEGELLVSFAEARWGGPVPDELTETQESIHGENYVTPLSVYLPLTLPRWRYWTTGIPWLRINRRDHSTRNPNTTTPGNVQSSNRPYPRGVYA